MPIEIEEMICASNRADADQLAGQCDQVTDQGAGQSYSVHQVKRHTRGRREGCTSRVRGLFFFFFCGSGSRGPRFSQRLLAPFGKADALRTRRFGGNWAWRVRCVSILSFCWVVRSGHVLHLGVGQRVSGSSWNSGLVPRFERGTLATGPWRCRINQPGLGLAHACWHVDREIATSPIWSEQRILR